MIDIVMFVVLLAGVLKASDVEAFAAALESWPTASLAPFGAAVLIVNVEIAIGLGWFLGLWKRAAWVVITLALATVTAYFAWFLDGTTVPDCGCFGPLQVYFAQLESARALVFRNITLLTLLLLGGGLIVADNRLRDTKCSRSNAAGFTLVELLVVLALVGVLLSLLFPALGGARKAAQGVVSDSNLRQHTTMFAMYAGGYDDMFPYFVYPDAQAVVRCNSGTVTINHWSAYSKWHYALAEEFYQGECGHESFYPPGVGRGGATPYRYGCSFVARPEYWHPEHRRGPEQWGPNRVSEVLFPSHKGLLFAYQPLESEFAAHGNGAARKLPQFVLPIAFVAGHVERVTLDRVLDGYRQGDGDFGGGAHHVQDYPFGLHTFDGTRGRDIE